MLGSDGRGAIPELLALTQAKRYRTQGLAGKALAVMGPEGVGALLSMVTNQPAQGLDLNGLFWCWRALGDDANRWVPVLLEQLRSTNGYAAGTSAVLLGLGHVQPEIVLPALSNAVYASDAEARRGALHGLGEFGVQARPVTPCLVRALGDPDPNVRVEATNALQRIAPEVLQTNR
jgi:HEAT repeat protein